MIVVRSPLRIDIAGGITDLAPYYKQYGAFMLAAAIDKYVYITINKRFGPELLVRYSKVEMVEFAARLEHPIIRECLASFGMDGKSLEICSIADVPGGTGLGSSASFTTALLKALRAYNKDAIAPDHLAEKAFEMEGIRLKEEGGKQDQYIASYGGIKGLEFSPDGKAKIESIIISDDTIQHLEENLLLFFVGYCRSASAILKAQRCRIEENDKNMLKHIHHAKDNALRTKKALEAGDLEEFAFLMDEHWESKRQRCDNMTNPQIDDWYALGKASGADGGLLLGAGGGGFLMFYSNDKDRLRDAMRKAGLRELRFRFDFEGTKLLAW
jgi:D-glycero-alpha-D-manno-heptose-7-phosphate kinase